MRFKAAVLGTALLMLGAGAASAGSNYVGLTGGAGMPTGDYGDFAGTGWNIGASGTHYINDMWGFGGDIAYHAWGASSDYEQTLPSGADLSFTALQATAHATMSFQNTGNIRPYAQVGLGMYSLGAKFSAPGQPDDDTSKSKFGYNVGAGMNFLTSSSMRWGFYGAYHIVPVSDEDGFQSDLNFAQLGVNVQWGVGGGN